MFDLTKTGQLFTLGGIVTVLIMFAIIGYMERPKRPRRIYPKGQEPDAGELPD